jgi:catalase
MNVVSQGARPNYQSSIQPLTYTKSNASSRHETFVGAAVFDLSEVTERESTVANKHGADAVLVDFEQPRALWQKVMAKDPEAQDRFVKNVAGHLGGAKSAEIKARQRECLVLLRDAN